MSITSPIFSLPAEMIDYLLGYLSPRDLESARRVCRVFFKVIQNSLPLKEQLNRSFREAWATLWKKIEILSLQDNLDPSILISLDILKLKLGRGEGLQVNNKTIEKIRTQRVNDIIKLLCSKMLFDKSEPSIDSYASLPNSSIFEIFDKQKAEGVMVVDLESLDKDARSTYLLQLGKRLLEQRNIEALEKLAESDRSLTFLFAHVLAAKVRSMQEVVPEVLKALKDKASALPNLSERNLVYTAIMLKFGESGNLSKVAELMLMVNHLDRSRLLARALKAAVENDFFSEVIDFLNTDEIEIYQEQEQIAVFQAGEMMGMLEDAYVEHIVLEALALSALKNGNREKAEEIAITIKDPTSLSVILSRMFPLITDKNCVDEIDRLLTEQNVDTKSYVLKELAQKAENEGYEEILKKFSSFAASNVYRVRLDWARVLSLKKENAKTAQEVLSLIQGEEPQEEAYLELLKFQVEKGFLDEAKETSTFLNNKSFQYIEGIKTIYQEELNRGSFATAKTTALLLAKFPDAYACAFESIAQAEMTAKRFYQAKDTIRSIADSTSRRRAFVSFVYHALEIQKKN